MEDWERTFLDKSERRRRRARLNTLTRRLALVAFIALIIGFALWAVETLTTEIIMLP